MALGETNFQRGKSYRKNQNKRIKIAKEWKIIQFNRMGEQKISTFRYRYPISQERESFISGGEGI
jgi:hypothetical protein